jgi:hypothetical protein
MALVKQFSGEFGSPCKHACVGIHFRARLKMENVFVVETQEKNLVGENR